MMGVGGDVWGERNVMGRGTRKLGVGVGGLIRFVLS